MSKKCKNCERCTQSLLGKAFDASTGIGVLKWTKDNIGGIAARKCPDCGHFLSLHSNNFQYEKQGSGGKDKDKGKGKKGR